MDTNINMNSEEMLALARKGVEPYASRYGYTAREEQTRNRKRAKKVTIAAKVVGLSAMMVGAGTLLVNQNTNILNQINTIPNVYLGALVELIYILALLTFVIMAPLKIIELALGLPGLHLAKEGELTKEDYDSNIDDHHDDFLKDLFKEPDFNIDGTPMIGIVDVKGKAYGR